MAGNARLICASAALTDSGKGMRFALQYRGETAPAFVIRYRGRVYAYLNRCAHIPVEMDWQPGRFLTCPGYTCCAPPMEQCICRKPGNVLVGAARARGWLPSPCRSVMVMSI